MKILRILLLIALVQLVLAQQPAPASVQGTVVADWNQQSACQCSLWSSGPSRRCGDHDGLGPARYVTTGPDGRFSFPRVPPSSYRLVATSRGYAACGIRPESTERPDAHHDA